MPISNPAAALIPVVKYGTRALAAASGDVSYTGYGGTPQALIILAQKAETMHSIGSGELTKDMFCFYLDGDVPKEANNMVVWLGSSTVYQRAAIKSYDSDGFTLTWTKAGAPTGTADLHIFAFK